MWSTPSARTCECTGQVPRGRRGGSGGYVWGSSALYISRVLSHLPLCACRTLACRSDTTEILPYEPFCCGCTLTSYAYGREHVLAALILFSSTPLRLSGRYIRYTPLVNNHVCHIPVFGGYTSGCLSESSTRHCVRRYVCLSTKDAGANASSTLEWRGKYKWRWRCTFVHCCSTMAHGSPGLLAVQITEAGWASKWPKKMWAPSRCRMAMSKVFISTSQSRRMQSWDDCIYFR